MTLCLQSQLQLSVKTTLEVLIVIRRQDSLVAVVIIIVAAFAFADNSLEWISHLVSSLNCYYSGFFPFYHLVSRFLGYKHSLTNYLAFHRTYYYFRRLMEVRVVTIKLILDRVVLQEMMRGNVRNFNATVQ